MIKNHTIYIIVLFFCFILFGNTHAIGQNINLVFHSDFAPTYKKAFSDSIAAYDYLITLLDDDESNGYLNAGYDSIVNQDNQFKAYYYRGEKFFWGDIGFMLDDSLKDCIPNTKYVLKKPPSTVMMRDYMKEIQTSFQSHGFANCQVETSNLKTKGNLVFWEVKVTPNTMYVLDSLIIQGDVVFPREIIAYRAGLLPGAIYNTKKISELSRGMYDPEFVRQSDPVKVTFSDTSYQIVLNYKKHTNNMISGMLGIVPGNETQNLYLTGDADLQLKNAFNSAESIRFEWAAYEPFSQRLEVQYEHPVIINALGVKSSFGLEKQDSSYLNLNFTGGIQVAQYASELYVFYRFFRSTIIENVDETQMVSDLLHRKIGISYLRQKLDYPQNPSDGYRLVVAGVGGLKQNLNDSIDSEGVGEFNSTLSGFIPVGNRFSIALKNASGIRYLKQALSKNEMFRIGGAQSFRGYHERSIFASLYSYFTIEGIFFPDKNSAIYMFSDLGLFSEDLMLQIVDENIMYSVGAGLRVATGIGTVAISYGIPRGMNLNLDFRQSKIHIGYVNNF